MDPVVTSPESAMGEPPRFGPLRFGPVQKQAALLWLAVALPVNTLIFVGRRLWGPGGRPLIDDAFMHWDARWFMTIARDGYSYQPGQQSDVVFAPAFPLIGRAASVVVGSIPLALFLVAAAFGLASFVLVATWFERRESEAITRSAMVLFALYPFTIYLTGIPYSEPLYLFTALAAFMALESDRPALAGLAGLVTTATRVTGVAVAVGLMVMVLTRRGALRAVTEADRQDGPTDGWVLGPMVISPRKLRGRDAWVLLSWVGLVAWMAYFQHRFDNPVLFSSGNFGAPGRWLSEPSIRSLLKVQYFQNLTEEIPAYILTTTIHGILAIGAILLMPAVVRRYGAAYGVFGGTIIAMSWITSGAFQGFGRYLLVVFPLFGPLAVWAARTALRTVWLPRFFGLGLLATTLMWANGHWVS